MRSAFPRRVILALSRASCENVGRGSVLLTRQVPSPLLPNPWPASFWCPHHDHGRQLDLGLVGWGQGDDDTGSDGDGGARGLDGTARWCHNPQLQLQRGVNHCWALQTEQGWRVKSQICSLGSPRGGGGGSGSALWEPRVTNKKTAVASQTLQNCVQSLCLCSHKGTSCCKNVSFPLFLLS